MKLIQTALGAFALASLASTAAAQVSLNEVYASHSGTDTLEFVELKGTAGAALTNIMFLVVEGDNSGGIGPNGTLDRAFDLTGTSIPLSGYYLLGTGTVVPTVDFNFGVSDVLENGTQQYFLVDAGSPAGVAAILALIGTDVSTPPGTNSTTTIIPSMATVLDQVAVDDGSFPTGDIPSFDGALTVGPDLVCCAGPEEPPGIFRDQDFPGAWCLTAYLDFDPVANTNLPRTPGGANVACGAGPSIFFCDASDGALAACPCSNPGSPNTGCDNAQLTGGVGMAIVNQTTSPNGATLSGTGFSTMGAPTAILIRSDSLDPLSPVVFGDGVRCVNSFPLVRLAATVAGGGTSTHTFGHASMAGAGDFYYQIWYRNTPSTYCDPFAGFNLSNGVKLTW